MTEKVSIIVPIYNEQENIALLVKTIREVFCPLPYEYNIIFIDDGSSDATLHVVKAIRDYDPQIHYISFSRNFGHQSALKAGIALADGDCIISMDGDLQHPPEIIPQLLEKWKEGYDVVYTVRKEDESLSLMKRKSSDFFYKAMNFLSDVPLEKGTADFRLISKKVAGIIRNLEDHELFLRGIIKWIGFKQYGIVYTPAARFQGKTKYTFNKMMRLATEGITSFSTKPLYAATYLGITFSFLSILYVPYALHSYYFGRVIHGWTSVIVTISFFGGLQLLILGVMGIYLGKLFMQAKKRPSYLIKESTIECQEKEVCY